MTYNIAVHFISLKSKFLKICAWFLLYRMLQLRLANIHVNLESERNVVICMIQPVLKLLFLGKWIKIIDGGLDIQIVEFIIPERILYVIFKGLGVWNLLIKRTCIMLWSIIHTLSKTVHSQGWFESSFKDTKILFL